MRRILALPVCAVLVFFTPTAQAQMLDGIQLNQAQQKPLDFALGAVVISEAAYPGAAKRHTFPFPLLDAQWKNGFFAGTVSGVGYRVPTSTPFQYGLRATLDFGRKASDTAPISDHAKISARPEYGAFLNLAPQQGWGVNTALRYGAGNARQGLFVDLEGIYEILDTEKQKLTLAVAVTYANREIMREYYGTTSAGSVYAPNAGILDDKLKLRYRLNLDARWSAIANLYLTQLQGQAKASPLAQERLQKTLIVGLQYTLY